MSSVLDVLGSKKTGYPGGGKKAKWGFGTWEKDWELEVYLHRLHFYLLSYYEPLSQEKKEKTKNRILEKVYI